MASGLRNMMMALVYKIRKSSVANKKAGRGCVRPKVCDRLLQLFCCPAPSLCLDFTNLWVKFSHMPGCYG